MDIAGKHVTSRAERRSVRDFVTGGTGLLLPGDPEYRSAMAERAGAPGGTARDVWLRWLDGRFPAGSAYITGTYTDEYGLSHGLMAPRNVVKDFRRFMVERELTDRQFIAGVEQHRYRDILHIHGIIEAPFTDVELRLLKAEWAVDRGHARVLPVLDGCASYVTKYALKGGTECFDWNLR